MDLTLGGGTQWLKILVLTSFRGRLGEDFTPPQAPVTLANLSVVDGSFFVSGTAVNPGLSIIANALRIGDHLLERRR